MKNLAFLLCGIFFTLAFSFTGLVLSSNIQVGGLTQTTQTLDEEGNLIAGETLYPFAEGGLALQGKQVYTEMGCVYCHTQQVRRKGFGADSERGWGPRQTVARDYITQKRLLLGTMRTGPDLAHLGGRYAGDAGRDWNHLHLYNPQIVSPGSTMPPFAFLYEVREIGTEASPNRLAFPPGSPYAPQEGYEVVPTPRAIALVEYLLSLKIDYSLPEMQIIE